MADRWRPITSAPKDGREVWLTRADRAGAVIGRWHKGLECWQRMEGEVVALDESGPQDNTPTHWQPFKRPAGRALLSEGEGNAKG